VLKAIIDANVFISALLNPGKARLVVEHLKTDSFQLIFPAQLLLEIRRVATNPKLGISENDTADLLRLISTKGSLVEPEEIQTICRDRSDDVYLACASVANCDFVVTGDNDLLSIGSYQSTSIISPSDFLTVIGSQKDK
jgi:putative PIN family toxin of toxin-antitoxin system